MRNDPERFCAAGANQIAQVPLVAFDVGLPDANRLPFGPKEPHVKAISPCLASWPAKERAMFH
jgi:hypothetical protein